MFDEIAFFCISWSSSGQAQSAFFAFSGCCERCSCHFLLLLRLSDDDDALASVSRTIKFALLGSESHAFLFCFALQLSDDALASVSRTIMGRLDIVDLVGRNTADEFAERVSFAVFCTIVSC